MKRLNLIFLGIAISASTAQSQTTVTPVLQLIDADLIADACMKRDSLLACIQDFTHVYTAALEKCHGDFDMMCQITLNPDQAPTIELASKPLQPDSLLVRVLTELQVLDSRRTDRSHYSFVYYAKVNAGADKTAEYYPLILSPEEQRFSKYKQLSTLEKSAALTDWLDEDILPVLAYYTSNVSKQFEGVRSIGKLLNRKDYLEQSAKKLTDENFNYWRACLEMAQWNMLIPFTKVCLLAREKKYDYAARLIFFTDMFSDESTISALYSPLLSRRIEMIRDEVALEIQKGIDLYDQGKYTEALEQYENTAKDFPSIAWLNFEIEMTKATLEPDKAGEYWYAMKNSIYGSDPLYPYCSFASNGREGHELAVRMNLSNYFTNSKELVPELVAVTDDALDLEEYAFAAQLYWLLFSHISEEKLGRDDLLSYFLYCEEKLGHVEIKTNFKGNHEKAFKQIEKKLDKTRKEDPMYQVFQK